MAASKQNVSELIQSAFPPMIAALVTPLAEDACRKNNLNFVEMLQPFCSLPNDAHIRDPSGLVLSIRPGLRVSLQYATWEPPAPPQARKWLNEAASLPANPSDSLAVEVGGRQVEMPSKTPWFEAWRNVFLQVQYPSDHEFLKHYLACVIVVSSEDPDPVASVQSLWSACCANVGSNPNQLPKWFFSPALQYHVLLHDASSPNADTSRAEQQFARLKAQFGESYCTLLPINTESNLSEGASPPADPWVQYLMASASRPQPAGALNSPGAKTPNALEEAQEVREETIPHPLSPDAPGSPGFAPIIRDISSLTGQEVVPGCRGKYLSAEDREKLRQLIPEFAVKVLLPYAEKQIHTLTELVIARKGLSRSLFSATKRWFGSSSKPGSTASSPQSSPASQGYSADSAERGLRRLGDLSFLLGLPQLSFPAYHALKRDLAADQAWLMLAGALEMAALSAFLLTEQPPTSPKRAQEYMEEAINTYLNLCKLPQFATRAALLSSEILKSRGLMGEAAQQLIRLTSEDSDLRSALLLEQAAYCFLGTHKVQKLGRKYGFHMVLAGHRFNKAGLRPHALRCYLQALQIFEGKHWGLAEDHILFTVGRQSAFLRKLPEARDSFAKLLCSGSQQASSQQSVFLREYLQTLQGILEGGSENGIPIMPIPYVDCKNIQTLLGIPSEVQSQGDVVYVSGTSFETKLDGEEKAVWDKLEEQLLTEAHGQTPMVFKPLLQLFTPKTNNSSKPNAVINEQLTVQLTVKNPLQIPLVFTSIRLLWNFTPEGSDSVITNENGAGQDAIDTQLMHLLTLAAGASQKIALGLIPRQTGEVNIIAVAFELCGPAPVSADQQPIAVTGKLPLSVRGPRLKGKEDGFAPDYRLTVVIKPPLPLLQARLEGLGNKMMCGETRRIGALLRNAGPLPLKNLFVSISPSDVDCLALPVGSKPPQSPLSNLGPPQQGYRVGSLTVSAESKVLKIPLPGEVLGSNQEASIDLWIKAPMKQGSLKLHLMMFYEGVEDKRYRTLQHSWRVALSNPVSITAQVIRSSCPSINGKQATTESLNLALQILHVPNSEPQNESDETKDSLSIQQIAIVSKHWHLAQLVISPKDCKLKPKEACHLLFKILRSMDKCAADKYIYSHSGVGSSLNSQLTSWPMLNFLIKEFLSTKTNNANSILDITLLLKWRVFTGKEIHEGQHQLSLVNLGTTRMAPQLEDVPLPALRPPPEISPELATAQSLVTYSLQHATFMMHDFKEESFCIVPVKVHLQNCSDSSLRVIVSANETPSGGILRSTQLYSPLASAVMCFIGPSRKVITLAPRASDSVCLKAGIPRPGTYDVSRRLAVICGELGKKETSLQTWKCPSPLIVSQKS
ncbi:trafficking protein particle complex subunit 8 [Neocloeon triangulifer]|uniref:trafficking protein particle complex subunit 8 n=1 Tax=Neocloeon triangulifer TaxID=2078957 RepID=UPI00286F447B|nr:trafficking protein particle complex subunit 8 [Neocloeon triangulifer]XP_059476344.1 trafficking protein particle complex subunit 8 [Neocloeon triangulifer]